MSEIIARAAALATRAHAGQVRKYTGEPYINHPTAVAALVASVPHTPEMIAAAYLHDVVEDTDATLDEVREACGNTVARYVYCLTDYGLSIGNRATRKSLDRHRLAASPSEVQTIKYADLIDNLSSIALHDPKFATVYRHEKRLLLNVIAAGDQTLYRRAAENAGC